MPPTTKRTTTAKKAAEAPQEAQGSTATTNVVNVAQGPLTGPDDLTGRLSALRASFPEEEIGKLPKGTCKPCRDMARSYRACESHSWIRKCGECGGQHSSAVVHLDYVGHADLTARLLDVDPLWTWEPFSVEQINALPPVLRDAGLWINLTVLGVTRPGFGDAQGKTGPNAVKEMIGDALRNAGMRFGIALDLWAKGDRNYAKAPDETPEDQVADPQAAVQRNDEAQQAALAADRGHTRERALNDMTRDAMPQPDRRRWDAHMGAFTQDFGALPPEVQQEVQRSWPQDVPTPSSGRMTITQIQAQRDRMAALNAAYAKHMAEQQAQPAQQAEAPTLPTEGDEPPF